MAADKSFLARADESGQCVSNPETGECINPDFAVEENVVEESAPEEPQEVAIEPVEEAVVEEVAEEVKEVAAAGTTTDESAPDAAEELEATPVEEETVPSDPLEEATTEETAPADPAEETTGTEPTEEEAPEETVTDTDAEEALEEENPGCPSRKHVIKCAAKYLDTNGNNYLEREELQAAIDKLPWLSRGILSVLGSVDKMMAKCDTDKDGAIGIDYDMTHNAETCLATCFKRRAFKSAFFPECQV